MRAVFSVAFLIGFALAAPASANDDAHPTVIELFQSQGCSSCPPALANINRLADRPDVIALTFAVTYWDQLGWKDTFASPAFTERQEDYARAGGRAQLSTPQVIVNGRGVTVGSNWAQLIATARSADRGTSGPSIAAGNGRVAIGAAPVTGEATVWLVRYDPRTLDVPIRAGENDGKTLAHRDVVRSLAQLGAWHGKAMSFALPKADNPLYRTAILVQQGTGGAIIAAAKI
jgi:hypothetical protein